ncbi:hypothetical protein [Nocardiopsis protaetiae]|uniref:hypothetical protein n=1 Tax=Nocardiopsis protaetiae TaxID=3382270 RepID=UPI00387AA3A4
MTETVDWKAKAREWEKRAKENKAAADRLAELEEAQKSEEQRRQEQLEEALGAASRTQHDLWRERAARRYGLDDELVPFLSGETEEEVLARAETLASKITAPAPGGRRPDPSQGQGGGGAPTLREQIRAAEAAGDTTRAIALKNQLLTQKQ